MNEEANLLLQALQSVGMSPQGVFTGLIGAVLSLFVVNGVKLTWKRAIFTLFAGTTICAFSYEVIEIFISNTSGVSLANTFTGYVVTDILASVKNAAPTMTTKALKKLGNIAGIKEDKKDE